MLSRDYFQKLDSLNNEMDILTDRIKKVSEEIRRMHEMNECPRCYQIFFPNEMNGQLCKGCVEFLEKENIK
jgi:RNase P subunit RPR2